MNWYNYFLVQSLYFFPKNKKNSVKVRFSQI
jgi:hypothetical protein